MQKKVTNSRVIDGLIRGPMKKEKCKRYHHAASPLKHFPCCSIVPIVPYKLYPYPLDHSLSYHRSHSSPMPRVSASQAGNDNVEDDHDSRDDSFKDGSDSIHDGH